MNAQKWIDSCDEPFNVKGFKDEMRNAEIRNRAKESLANE